MKNIDNIQSGEPFNIISTKDLMNLALKLVPEMACQLKDCNYSQEYINGMMFGMARLAIEANLDKDAIMTVNIKKEAEAPTESHECQCEKMVKDNVEAFRKKILDVLDSHAETLKTVRLTTAICAELEIFKKLKNEIENL